ncbi:MAG: MoaD/ThiS family protein, partial [Candidatus Heimdallarchaeota archaeon]|nr:MoaD/ThiS family protein [Candidatus Heimdallarchaeota archaeon]
KNDLPEKGLIVVINGSIAPSLETIIKPEDKILILPAVAGGFL